jgi:hypothetical protein
VYTPQHTVYLDCFTVKRPALDLVESIIGFSSDSSKSPFVILHRCALFGDVKGHIILAEPRSAHKLYDASLLEPFDAAAYLLEKILTWQKNQK